MAKLDMKLNQVLLDEKMMALTSCVPQKRPYKLRVIYQDGGVHLVERKK